jgi:hypothetical protein
VKGVQQGRLHGQKSVELLVQPTKAGVFTVPSFTLDYFDPDTGRYEVARSQEVSVRVKPAAVDPDGGRTTGTRRITHNARPVMRNLTPPLASGPLYVRPWYAATLGAGVLVGVAGFALGVARAKRKQTRGAEEERLRKLRRAALERAREEKDLSAAERVLYDALARAFGDEVRGLPAFELERLLEGRLGDGTRRELLAWLEAAQAARYAPRGAADKKGLFDDAERLLEALEARP